MRGRLAVLVAGFCFLPPVWGQVVSERPDGAVVTIYHEGNVDTATITKPRWEGQFRSAGLAFITETRTIDLPAGPATIELRGVASTMVPQTAEIQGLPAEILERNFDYDLLSPASLLDKSVGSAVKLVRTDAKTGKTSEQIAVVRSGAQGTVLDLNGRFEALHCSGLPEKLVFDKIPESLRDTPTLSIHTRAAAAGRYTIKLSYIATAMNWSADYVAHINPDGKTLDLNGWITLTNFGETGFANVPVEVVAGHLQTTGDDVPVTPKQSNASAGCWPMDIDWATMKVIAQDVGRFPDAAPPPPAAMRASLQSAMSLKRSSIEAVDLGDYKLYALPDATDLWAKRTKQVQFLAKEGVPFERVYAYDMACTNPENDEPAAVLLRFKNTEASHLGAPMPAGSVSVAKDAGATPVFLGQDRIQDVSVGLPVEIKLGNAMGVNVQCAKTEEKTTGFWGRNATRSSYEVTVRNDKPVPVAFEVRQDMQDGSHVVSETARHAVKPEGYVWAVALAPNEKKVLRFAIEVAR